MAEANMINIFNYTDFLSYFEDYYAWQKRDDPSFAYSTIAQKAGFNNKGWAFLLFHGERKISPVNCRKISKALNHSRKEAVYFQLLVEFKQTNELPQKKRLYEKISRMTRHGQGFTRAQLLSKDQYEYYSTWYHSAVRSIIGMYPFKDDYFWLGRMMIPPITTGQAKKSVELLKRLGLVTEGGDKRLTLTTVSVTSGSEILGTGLRNFHYECADLAKEAIRKMKRDERNITGLTLGVSKAAYSEICNRVAAFQNELMEIANAARDADRVYQINFHLFPLSRSDKKRVLKP